MLNLILLFDLTLRDWSLITESGGGGGGYKPGGGGGK